MLLLSSFVAVCSVILNAFFAVSFNCAHMPCVTVLLFSSNFMQMNFIVSAIIGARLVSFFPAFAQSAEPLYSISSNVHRTVIAVLIVFASVSLCLYAPNIALFNMLIPAVELSPKLLKGSQI